MSHPAFTPSHKASPHFGRYSFLVPQRVGGWVGLGGWLHTEVVCPPEDRSPIPVLTDSTAAGDWTHDHWVANDALTTRQLSHHLLTMWTENVWCTVTMHNIYCAVTQRWNFFYCTTLLAQYICYGPLSVTSRYSIKIAKHTTQIMPHSCLGTLVFWYRRYCWNSSGITPNDTFPVEVEMVQDGEVVITDR